MREIWGWRRAKPRFLYWQVCVSPAMSDVSETKTTLNFGLRAMKVTNTAYVNVEVRVNPEVKARDVDFCTNQINDFPSSLNELWVNSLNPSLPLVEKVHSPNLWDLLV